MADVPKGTGLAAVRGNAILEAATVMPGSTVGSKAILMRLFAGAGSVVGVRLVFVGH